MREINDIEDTDQDVELDCQCCGEPWPVDTEQCDYCGYGAVDPEEPEMPTCRVG